ncbi:MAG: hypothetical protein RIE08_05860 [Acidimicrobiales bacterium]
MSQNDGPGILLRHGEGPWRAPDVVHYLDEAHLQALLVAQPSLLPEVDEFTVAVSELHVPETGSVDVVAVSADGDITLCECKLAKNSEIRRTIVGQVLAYASGLEGATFEEFDRAWRQRSDVGLAESAASTSPDLNEAEFLDAVASNLQKGAFRLVLAVDRIDRELQRIVEYLSRHTTSDTTVVALEMRYAAEGEVEVMVPRVYGVELARQKRPRDTNRWTKDDVIERATQVDPEHGAVVTRILNHFGPRVDRYYLGRGNDPSITAIIEDPKSQPFSIWGAKTVTISVNFEYLVRLGRDVQNALLERLRGIDVLAPHVVGVAEADYRKRPGIPIADLTDPGVLDQLISALEIPFDMAEAQ